MKRFKSPLFYTDGRGETDPALSRAVELARRNGGRLTVVGVVRDLPRELSRLAAGIHPAELQELAMKELHVLSRSRHAPNAVAERARFQRGS